MDGLRGAALRVVPNITADELAKPGGLKTVLKAFNQALKRRRHQECRELYNAGAQTHGVLSRQRCEFMISFILRRCAW